MNKFPEHICNSECSCMTCKEYINKLEYSRTNEVKSEKKVIFHLDQTSDLNKVGGGERKFDLPKPRLSRPNNEEV